MATATTKALTPREPPPPPAVPVASAWDEWEPEAVEGIRPIFPELKLIQKEVPDIPDSGKHGGEFWFSASETYGPVAVGVILHAAQTRALFDEDERAPVCSSDNGVTPRPGGAVWERDTIRLRGAGETAVTTARAPSSCATCEFNQWLDGKKPACRESYLALFEAENDGALYRFRFSGTAIGPMRAWMGRLLGSGVRRGQSARPRPWFSKRVKLEPVREQNLELGHVWYRPDIQTIDDVPESEAAGYIQFARDLREQFVRTVTESHADLAPDDARDVTPGGDGWGDGSQSFAPSSGQRVIADDELPFE